MTKPSDDFYKRMADTSPGVLLREALDALDALDKENSDLRDKLSFVTKNRNVQLQRKLKLYDQRKELRAELNALDLEIAKLQYFKMEIQKQASHRRECVDDYVMGAKAAFDDYYNKDPRKLDLK